MIEWIVTSSVLILIMIALRAVLRKHISTRLQYILWALVLVRLLIPFSLPSQTSVANFVPQAAVETLDRPITTPNFTPQQLPQLTPPASDDTPVVTPQQPEQDPVQEQLSSIREEMEAPITWESVFLIVWVSGMVAMSALLIISNLRFYLKLKRSRTKIEIDGSPLPVYGSRVVNSPCLFGLFRPAVYLTEEVQENNQLQGYVMAHELAHYRTGDHVWSLLRSICLVLHWYNPLVWVAAVLSKRDAESWCDESAIRSLGEHTRQDYGQALIRMSCIKKDAKALLTTATTMSGGKKALTDRVRLIAKHPKTAVYTLVLVLVIALVAVGCTFTGQQTASAPSTDPNVESTEPATEPSEEQEQLKPTGYPEDEVQVILAYINGQLYVHDSTAEIPDTVPQGYSYAGVVRHEDNHSVPKQEKHACHLEVGTALYINKSDDTYIYYWRYPKEKFPYPHRMIRLDMSGYTLDYEEPPENDAPSFPEITSKEQLKNCSVLINGLIYSSTEQPKLLSELPEGVFLYGRITHTDQQAPSKELEGCGLPDGIEVFLDQNLSYAHIYCQVEVSKQTSVLVLEPIMYINHPALDHFDPPQIQALPDTYDAQTLVTTYASKSISRSDNFGNQFSISHSIPYIYPFSADAVRVQAWIHYALYGQTIGEEEAANNGYSSGFQLVEYRSYLNNGVLSVVIIRTSSAAPITLHSVFNFDLTTGKLLGTDALLDKLGISQQDYLSRARTKAHASYLEEYPHAAHSASHQQKLAATLEDGNLQASSLYLDENGDLVAVILLRPVAGPSFHEKPTTIFKASEFPISSQSGKDLTDKYQALFSDWNQNYRLGLHTTYADPTQLDLTLIFYGQLDEWRELTEAERAHLQQAGFVMEMDVQIHSAAFVEDLLQKLFGIGISDLPASAFQSLHYWAETDCYYSNHNDAYVIDINVIDVSVLEDGRIRMIYEDRAMSWVTPTPTYVAIFTEKPDGSIQFHSNLPT